ncbi:response regulator transcription factor [Lentzea guizhouensis]|uniref:response regulator transcription factor n=1 Tax=Lentzea guizhouensis TaxID=1586287 RepID=UPI001F02CC05|nr:LuxR C-terminal-related transcriptional regulator [Lentzea guizhouensis]
MLREAYHKIGVLAKGNHYAVYDYLRAALTKITPVDCLYVGILQGANRVRYPYGFDSGAYDDPAVHTYGPHGQTAWLLKHRVTYRYAYDNGAVLHAGVMCGDTSRRSADAITAPMLRPDRDGNSQVFGMVSVQSYAPDAFDDNTVRALEWLTDLLARLLRRDADDREALRLLPAGDSTTHPVTADHIVEHLGSRVAEVRAMAEQARRDPADSAHQLALIVRACEQLQSELIEMTLDLDDGPEQRFLALTPVEQEVALHLAEGHDNDQLAAELGRSPHTVRTHLRAIFRKYGMATRHLVAEDVCKYVAR